MPYGARPRAVRHPTDSAGAEDPGGRKPSTGPAEPPAGRADGPIGVGSTRPNALRGGTRGPTGPTPTRWDPAARLRLPSEGLERPGARWSHV
ncbi:hypothetical protein GCM10022206_04420 [Streptomyces chiangmaiensis]